MNNGEMKSPRLLKIEYVVSTPDTFGYSIGLKNSMYSFDRQGPIEAGTSHEAPAKSQTSVPVSCPSTRSQSDIGAISGEIVGAIIFHALLHAVILYCDPAKAKQRSPQTGNTYHLPMEPNTGGSPVTQAPQTNSLLAQTQELDPRSLSTHTKELGARRISHELLR